MQTPEKSHHQFSIGKKFLDQFDLKDKIILDLGCGTGNLSFLMKEKGARKVIGIDTKEGSINKAKEKLLELKLKSIEFKVMDAHNLNLNETFDIVFCNISFHHFKNKPVALKEAYRVLNKGGLLLIITPLKGHKNEFQTIKKQVLNRPEFNKFESDQYPSKKVDQHELKRLLEQAEFKDINILIETIACKEKSIEKLLDFYGGCINNALPSSMPDEMKQEAWNKVKKKLIDFYKDKPIIVNWKVIFASAKK